MLVLSVLTMIGLGLIGGGLWLYAPVERRRERIDAYCWVRILAAFILYLAVVAATYSASPRHLMELVPPMPEVSPENIQASIAVFMMVPFGGVILFYFFYRQKAQ